MGRREALDWRHEWSGQGSREVCNDPDVDSLLHSNRSWVILQVSHIQVPHFLSGTGRFGVHEPS